jgi:hypothetical protein
MDLRMIQRFAPWVMAGLVVLLLLVSIPKLVEWNYDENFQIIEYPSGEVVVVDTAGFHWQGFGEVFTYPRYMDIYYSAKKDEGTDADGSIQVTFNDGGWGETSNFLKVQLPVAETDRISMHRHFGQGEEKDAAAAIGHHLMNSLKNSGPLMSASEHQAQRKSEFYQVVFDQLQGGLYVMERVEQTVDRGSTTKAGVVDDDHTFVTKIKRDADGSPIVAAPSPFEEYKFSVKAYNLTGTEYDPETKLQISAKRESYQQAEQAKAATTNEQQKLLEVIEKGKLAVAGIEADENKLQKSKLVAAQQIQDVAQIKQRETVTSAEEVVAVAGETLKKTKTDVEISIIKVEQAKAEAAELIATSEATQAKLERGGALSERDQVMAQMRLRRTAALTEGISKIPAPKTVILGGNGEGGQAGNGKGTQTDTLMQLFMLKQLEEKK